MKKTVANFDRYIVISSHCKFSTAQRIFTPITKITSAKSLK